MIRENRACRLHVAHARELQLEVDPVGLTLGLRAFPLLLLRLVLRTLRGFLAAIGLTVHAVPPFVSLGGQQEGSPPTCDEVSGLSQVAEYPLVLCGC